MTDAPSAEIGISTPADIGSEGSGIPAARSVLAAIVPQPCTSGIQFSFRQPSRAVVRLTQLSQLLSRTSFPCDLWQSGWKPGMTLRAGDPPCAEAELGSATISESLQRGLPCLANHRLGDAVRGIDSSSYEPTAGGSCASANSWKSCASPGSMLSEVLALTGNPIAIAQLANQSMDASPQQRIARVQVARSDTAENVAGRPSPERVEAPQLALSDRVDSQPQARSGQPPHRETACGRYAVAPSAGNA